LWLHSLKVAQLLRSAACLHTNQSRSYLNHVVIPNYRVAVDLKKKEALPTNSRCMPWHLDNTLLSLTYTETTVRRQAGGGDDDALSFSYLATVSFFLLSLSGLDEPTRGACI